jgi:uncharacterized protein YjcR
MMNNVREIKTIDNMAGANESDRKLKQEQMQLRLDLRELEQSIKMQKKFNKRSGMELQEYNKQLKALKPQDDE